MPRTVWRYNTLRQSPPDAKYRLAVVQFKVPGAKNGGSDKGPDGNRIDSIPIANGVIAAGGACDLVLFDSTKNKTDVEEFFSLTSHYDALIVRINPGQLSQGTEPGTQQRFDDLMNHYISEGKLVWSSPKIQTQMGAKDALVKIGKLGCGLPDTLAYYDAEALEKGFKACCAYQPRVIKQNRGSAGEGIWLCWLAKKADNSLVPFTEYPAKSLQPSDDGLSVETDASLGDDDWLKLMEMNDNHVEFHTVKEFMVFCVDGPEGAGAGKWTSTFPGKYLEGGKEAGGQLVDQRLLPRIEEGEVRILMAGDTCQMAIHKKPIGGGLSAVGGNSDYTYYRPEDPKYANMIATLYKDIPTLLPCMGLGGEPLPLLWTCDYIPKNPEGWSKAENASDAETEYVVGEFNCSCVGISKFQAVCGGEKTLADVSDEDYADACDLTDLMGTKAIEMLDKAKYARVNKGARFARRLKRLPDAVVAGKYTGDMNAAGQREGNGQCKYADGAVFEGTFKANVAQWPGTFRFADGSRYEGKFEPTTRSGKGTFRWADGRAEIIAFASNAAVGEGAGWSADGTEAWRLVDGDRQEGTLDLETAASIAQQLGLAVPNIIAEAGGEEEEAAAE